MLDIKFVRENPDLVKKMIKNRSLGLDIDAVLSLDDERRKLTAELEKLQCSKNELSEEIAKMMAGEKVGATDLISDAKVLSQKIADLKPKVDEVELKMANFMLEIPNICDKSVPVGKTEKQNKVVRTWGQSQKFRFSPRDHLELSEELGIIDITRATKISGSNFILFMGDGARLERALYNFMLDLHTKKHGYIEVAPPYLVNRASMTATGQLPKLEEDMYKLQDDDLFLIPTAEVPVTNIHRNELLDRKSTRLNSSHIPLSRMPSSA